MAFDPVYTKTIVAVTLSTGSGIEAAPPSGFTWIITDVNVVMTTAGLAGSISIDVDFNEFVYWSQPHGMKRTWWMRTRRACLENVLATFTSDVSGSASIAITAYELSTAP